MENKESNITMTAEDNIISITSTPQTGGISYGFNASSTNSKDFTESFLTENVRPYKSKRIRSKSLGLSYDAYSQGEIRRIKERLLRTNSQIEKSVIQNLDRSQKMTLFLLALVDFMSFCSMSIMAPFFPREAAEKGVSDTVSGFVFSFYALVMFVTSPVFGKILPRVGAKFIFVSGIFITGSCNILFGLLEYIEDYTQFTLFCFIIRGFEALGASAFSTASYVFVIHTFPNNMGSVLGMLETFVGLGMSAGPAVGGLLYSLGGFQMPFFTLGVAMLLIVPIVMFLLPRPDDINVNDERSGSFLNLIKIPSVIVTGMIIIIIASTWGFLDPTLEPHLRQFNLSAEQIGLIFLLFSGLYGVFSPLWGWLADRIENHWCMVVWGLLLCTVELLLLGPCPFIPFLENYLWLNIVALSGLGISVALALLPTFQGILNSATEGGCPGSITTYSMVAGIWSCMYSLGEVIGPSMGGILLEHYGFPITATVMAFMTFSMAIITSLFFCAKSRQCNDWDNSSDSGISGTWKTGSSERTPLLDSMSQAQDHRLYIEEKIQHYEQSRKMDHQIGEVDRNQVTDVRGTVSLTMKGSCEA